MSDRPTHCPFLNRTDDRCSDHFKLDHLQHAFKFCFGAYKSCPVYLELFLQRQVRRTCGVKESFHKESFHGERAGRVALNVLPPDRAYAGT